MENRIRCLKCGEKEIWKAGTSREKWQYQCKKCKRKFITELNYSEEFKRKAIQILYEGNSGRDVGRIMGINKSIVLANLSSIFLSLSLLLGSFPFGLIFNLNNPLKKLHHIFNA